MTPMRTLSLALTALLAAAGAGAAPRTLDILEFRVEGVDHLSLAEVEAAVGKFMGPGRTLEDVENARLALEKAYSDKGFQSVSVAVPPQTVRDGVVVLRATEGKVGRLRVRGARWFTLSEIKKEAPSVAEGSVPNFNDIVTDIATLNQLPDRRVTPALRAGSLPGTIDVDLNVQDHLPLHGSVEFNNRYSANTTRQRLNGTLRYDNLWQQGHSLDLSVQTAPDRLSDGIVFAATYLARFLGTPWFSLTGNAIIQDSDISTLGGATVVGRGRIFGARATFTLPSTPTFFHTLTTGIDYKHFGKELSNDQFAAPIVYWPLTAQYSAALTSETSQTQFGGNLVLGTRGLGTGDGNFDARRYQASANFIYLRADFSRTQELGAFQLSGRVQGQYSADPLVPSEQLTAGGAESVRGYQEAQAAGDFGVVGSVELRSPSLGLLFGSWITDWRVHVFADGARVAIHLPLPEQQRIFILTSAGGGSRLRLFDHLAGSFDLGVPLHSVGDTQSGRPRGHFRLIAEF
jgi:hemolysin activation/secretion protein